MAEKLLSCYTIKYIMLKIIVENIKTGGFVNERTFFKKSYALLLYLFSCLAVWA